MSSATIDPKIQLKEVAVTCENCGIENCAERVAPPSRYEKKLKNQALNEAIDAFIGKN